MYCVVPFIQPCLRPTDVAQSSLQCSVPLAGPVVNVVDEENEPSTSFASTLTSCSEDHYVHICSTTISADVSPNITEPSYSIDINISHKCHTINSTGTHTYVCFT